MAEVDMSQSIQTYFLYYKGGYGYVLNGSEALGLEGTNPLPPFYPESGLLFDMNLKY